MKLNIGGGDTPLNGYVNIDRKHGGEAFPLTKHRYVGPLDTRHSMGDECADEIRASHVLEHFGHRETLAVLKEWVRVLKTGGVLKIAVPDFQKCFEHSGHPMFEHWLMGSQTDENDIHGALFTHQKLASLMRAAGLSGILKWTSEIDDCASLPISLNLLGKKRGAADLSDVQPVMSIGRLMFSDQVTCLCNLISNSSLRPLLNEGVFWGQSLTQGLEQADADFILVLDHDTLFTVNQVEELRHLMSEHPEADAVCGLQMLRGKDNMIIARREDDNSFSRDQMNVELMPIDAGNFGCTIIRSASLKKLPHPWFLSVPDKHGKWSEGKLDEDMRFWSEWKKAGLTLFLATQIRLGHLQLMASWVGPDLKAQYQHVGDFRSNGSPHSVTGW